MLFNQHAFGTILGFMTFIAVGLFVLQVLAALFPEEGAPNLSPDSVQAELSQETSSTSVSSQASSVPLGVPSQPRSQ